MDHRQTSIQFLRSTALFPVKLMPGQASPFPEYDPRRIASEDHKATIRQIEHDPKLNLGALFHGKYVDIDIDTNEPYVNQALDYFLPNTAYIWGRKGKRRSHRVYTLHEDFDRGPFTTIARFMKKLVDLDGRSYSIEIRGGKPENGMMTVLPGSFREKHMEWVEWETELDVSISSPYVKITDLFKGTRLALAAAIMANYWTDGVRNDLSLALAGLLWRIRASSLAALGLDHEDEVDETVFLCTEADALHLLKCIMDMADPTTQDHRARELNFSNSWRKLDTDPAAKVTGGKVMAEIIGPAGDAVVKTLYRLLSDNEGIEQMEALSEQYMVWYGQGVLLDIKMVEAGSKRPYMTKEQATNSLGNRKVSIGNKKIPVTNLLFTSAIIQRVRGLTFDPSSTERFVETDEGTKVNQWRGFRQLPCEQKVSDQDVEPFIDYMRNVIANGDEKAYQWITTWCAALLQMPGKKPGTAPVLVGVQGAGKTFLGERILGKIIGESHYMQMNSIGQLTKQFNSVADNRIFIQCNEATHSYQKETAAQLKSIVTDETITIEPKFVDSFQKPNHLWLMFTSNDKNTAIFIDPSPHERRFTVLEVSEAKCNDIEYWDFMHAWMEMNLHKVMRWLLDFKVDRKLVMRPHDTAAKRDIQRVGVDPEIAWIVSRLHMGFPLGPKAHQHWWQAFDGAKITDAEKKANILNKSNWPDTINLPALEEDFRQFVREHGRSVYSGSVITNIKRAFPKDSILLKGMHTVSYMDPKSGQMTKDRVRMYSLPTRDQTMDFLRSVYGEMVDRMMEEVANEANVPEVEHPETQPTDY